MTDATWGATPKRSQLGAQAVRHEVLRRTRSSSEVSPKQSQWLRLFTRLVVIATILMVVLNFVSPILGMAVGILLAATLIHAALRILLAHGRTPTPMYRFLVITVFLLVAVLIAAFSTVYQFTGLLDMHDSVVRDDSETLYFSACAFLSCGYCDFRPSPASRVFALVESVLGYCVLALVVSLLLVFFENVRRRNASAADRLHSRSSNPLPRSWVRSMSRRVAAAAYADRLEASPSGRVHQS